MQQPDAALGLRHVALRVVNLEACERFYVDLLGMRVEWRPDPDNLYLTTGSDNLALHRVVRVAPVDAMQRLDHIGFIVHKPEHVDEWCAFLHARGVTILKLPKTHRDGARSFYCADPEGNVVQVIYHPPISKTAGR